MGRQPLRTCSCLFSREVPPRRQRRESLSYSYKKGIDLVTLAIDRDLTWT